MKRFQKLDDTGKASIMGSIWVILFSITAFINNAMWWVIFCLITLMFFVICVYDARLERTKSALEQKKRAHRAMYERYLSFVEEEIKNGEDIGRKRL